VSEDKPAKIDQDEASVLRALRSSTLPEGALPLILAARVKDPVFTARRLARKRLASRSKGAWSLTEEGKRRAEALQWDGERWV